MIVGNKAKVVGLYRKKSDASIAYAVKEISKSPVAPYVKHLFLYGSCARNTQTYKSDVDLFLVLSEKIDTEQLHDAIMILKSKVTPTDSCLPEVDLKVEIGDSWRENSMLYYKNVRKEGIEIWQK